jgi:hypothetical protein
LFHDPGEPNKATFLSLKRLDTGGKGSIGVLHGGIQPPNEEDNMPKLTDAQLLILSAAAKRDGGAILPLPKNLKIDSKAASSILNRLLKKKLIVEQPAAPEAAAWRDDGNGQRLMLILTDAGMRAIGIAPGGDLEAGGIPARKQPREKRAKPAKSRATKPRGGRGPRMAPATSAPAPRVGSKQAKVIDLLSRPTGANMHDLVKATGWQAHSVRGVISAALKKKLGLAVVSEKAESGERRYRIAG